MLNLTLCDLDHVFALDNSSDTLTYHHCHSGSPLRIATLKQPNRYAFRLVSHGSVSHQRIYERLFQGRGKEHAGVGATLVASVIG